VRWLALLALSLAPATAEAHSLEFGVLHVREVDRGAILSLRAGGSEGRPPALDLDVGGACALDAPPRRDVARGLLAIRGRASCFEGATITIEGLDRAGIRVATRVVRADGSEAVHFLEPGHTSLTITPEADPPPVFGRYARLGVEHLAVGLDHLLFLLALVLVVFDPRVERERPLRSLLLTVTGFTAGHAVTLSLAILGGLTLPGAPVEACIALSIVFLAAELVRERPTLVFRRPWLVAAGFGLLHGLGFAGALTELGLPPADAPVALVAFHVGLELAQVGFVALALVVLRAARGLAAHRRWLAYAVGAVAAGWVALRVEALIA